METRSKRAAMRVADGGDAAAEDGYGGALTDWRALVQLPIPPRYPFSVGSPVECANSDCTPDNVDPATAQPAKLTDERVAQIRLCRAGTE